MALHARRIAEGQMEAEVQLVSTDEFAVLAQTFNQMAFRIKSHWGEVQRLADNLHQAVRQLDSTSNVILSVSTEQSSGATEQASAVAEASAIAQEIVSTAKQIAERAGRVDEVSAGTLEACKGGKQQLQAAVAGFENIREQMTSITTAMERLEDRFREMDKITAIIEDVAEQTELLALNAALEAAGAGEQGRRFGVVAQATRRLANRATEATVEIRELLGSLRDATLKALQMVERGQTTVETGRTLIDGVAQSIEQISAQAQDTSTAVREISISTQQQTSASEQMAHAIGEVNEVAKQVAEGAKEIERTFGDLTKFTESLRRLITR
jgi:methyl-accepting chemotaxis protein